MNDTSNNTAREALGNLPDATAASRNPPAFGIDKQSRLRILEWYEKDPNQPGQTAEFSALIPHERPVGKNKHEPYRARYSVMAKALQAYRAAGIDPPFDYVLLDESNKFVGCGQFDVADDAHEMARIACFFLERHRVVELLTAEEHLTFRAAIQEGAI